MPPASTTPSIYADAALSLHAQKEMNRRGISEKEVRLVLESYESSERCGQDRIALHKTLFAEDIGKLLLYRVFIDTDCHPPIVVTAYRTSKFRKYRNHPQ